MRLLVQNTAVAFGPPGDVLTLDVGGGNKLRVLKANVLGAWQEKPVVPAKPEKK